MNLSVYLGKLKRLNGVLIVGGAMDYNGLRPISSDIDVYSKKLINDYYFPDGTKLEQVTEMGTDGYEVTDNDSSICLTDYLFSDKNGFVSLISGNLSVLKLSGLFITKLVSYDDDTERVKDFDDLKIIYAKWGGKLLRKVSCVIKKFGLDDAFNNFLDELND